MDVKAKKSCLKMVSNNENLKAEIEELIKNEEKLRKVRQQKEAEFRRLIIQQFKPSQG
jgi:cell division protein FtsL